MDKNVLALRLLEAYMYDQDCGLEAVEQYCAQIDAKKAQAELPPIRTWRCRDDSLYYGVSESQSSVWSWLARHGIETYGELLLLTEDELEGLRGIAAKSVGHVVSHLNACGLQLRSTSQTLHERICHLYGDIMNLPVGFVIAVSGMLDAFSLSNTPGWYLLRDLSANGVHIVADIAGRNEQEVEYLLDRRAVKWLKQSGVAFT